MSYVRPVKRKELIDWLLSLGYLNESFVDDLADDLIERFDVITTSAQP